MKGFSKCPHCGYKTYMYGCCMSCGFGIVEKPILKKNAAKKKKSEPKKGGS